MNLTEPDVNLFMKFKFGSSHEKFNIWPRPFTFRNSYTTKTLLCYKCWNREVQAMYDIKQVKNMLFQSQIIQFSRSEHGSP